MTEHGIRVVVDQHYCDIGGTRYAFKLNWVASEKDRQPGSTRHLLCVDVVATPEPGNPPGPLHLFVWLAPPAELRSSLEDALRCRLAGQVFPTTAARSHRVRSTGDST